jgi:hypothetical protein
MSAAFAAGQAVNYFPTIQTGNIDNVLWVDGRTYVHVQDALNALPTGGGTVIVPCSSTPYQGPTNIPSGAHIKADCGKIPSSVASMLAYLDGQTANTVTFQYNSTLTLTSSFGISLDHIVLDFGNNGGLVLDGVNNSDFLIAVVNCLVTTPCVTMTGSITNNGGNRFYYLATDGGSTSLKLSGGNGDVTSNVFDFLLA